MFWCRVSKSCRFKKNESNVHNVIILIGACIYDLIKNEQDSDQVNGYATQAIVKI